MYSLQNYTQREKRQKAAEKKLILLKLPFTVLLLKIHFTNKMRQSTFGEEESWCNLIARFQQVCVGPSVHERECLCVCVW